MSSRGQDNDIKKYNVERVKDRFETDFLPKYGALWRKMIETKQAPPKPMMSFVDAIHTKKAISIVVPTHDNDCDCGCVPPILEWESKDNDKEEMSSQASWSTNCPEATTPSPDDLHNSFGRIDFDENNDYCESSVEAQRMTSSDKDDQENRRQATSISNSKSDMIARSSICNEMIVKHEADCNYEDAEENGRGEEEDDDETESSGDTVLRFDLSHIVQSPPEKEDASRRASLSPPEINMAKQDESTIEADVCDDSHSSGSSVHHFDLSHILQSTPEKGERTPDVTPKLPSLEKPIFSPETNPRLSPRQELSIEKDTKTEENEDFYSCSSGSSIHHFDVSHIVEDSSPRKVTNAADPISQPPSENISWPEMEPRLDSRENDAQSDGGRSDNESSGSSIHRFDLSHIESPRESLSLENASNMTNQKGMAQSFTQNQNEESKVNISSFNGSVLIDLVDSESDDDWKEDASNEQKNSETRTTYSNHPRRQLNPTMRRTNQNRVLVDSDSDDELLCDESTAFERKNSETRNTYSNRPRRQVNTPKTGGSNQNHRQQKDDQWENSDRTENESDENEWDEDSSTECGFESPEETDSENGGINDLINRTKMVEILSDSDDDDEDENLNPNKRKSNRPRGKQKVIGMTKAAFKKNRDSLSKQTFSEFDQAAFSGKLSSVEVVWSNTLRTTAGLTRLKKSYRNMRPGVPQERLASIELSTKVLDNNERLRSTLLHEMVHAAAWIVDGVSKPPHGACFKKWAKVASKATGIVVTTTHDYEIQYKYAWVSTKCSYYSFLMTASFTDTFYALPGLYRPTLYVHSETPQQISRLEATLLRKMQK